MAKRIRGTRERLDETLVARGLAETRSQARALIMAGAVRQGDRVLDKPGMPAPEGPLEVAGGGRFVSRGGEKLAHALAVFGVDPAGLVCADLGASTGGFTDCLLQAGAARVYAVDVGYGQLHWKLRQDPRVVAIERTNARYLDGLPEPVALVVADLSFISLALILPVIHRLLTAGPERGARNAERGVTGIDEHTSGSSSVPVPRSALRAPRSIVLVKPQFEAGREAVGKGGVVRDPATHRAVLLRFVADARREGFAVLGLTASPLRGPAGNVEFLAYLGRDVPDPGTPAEELADGALAAVAAQPSSDG